MLRVRLVLVAVTQPLPMGLKESMAVWAQAIRGGSGPEEDASTDLGVLSSQPHLLRPVSTTLLECRRLVLPKVVEHGLACEIASSILCLKGGSFVEGAHSGRVFEGRQGSELASQLPSVPQKQSKLMHLLSS